VGLWGAGTAVSRFSPFVLRLPVCVAYYLKLEEGKQEMASKDWVFEFLCHVMQSPSWEVPLMTFIDETCAIFDNEEESKLAHTTAHEEFKELVENLLTQHLAEIGTSTDDFYEACEVIYASNHHSGVAVKIVEQLVACDDFLTFKALMFKRNKELEVEALMALDGTGDDELLDVEYNRILRKSSAESKEAELLARQDSDILEDTATISVRTQRLKELSLLEKEQADLEAAITLSLAMEEERLRIRESESKFEDDEQKESKEDDFQESKHSDERRSSLPPLGHKRSQIQEARRAVQKSFGGPIERTMMKGTDEFDEVDLARRKRHLEAQRQRILEKKNAERATKLKEFETQKDLKSDPAKPSCLSNSSTVSAKQEQLTHALAGRMKQDLLSGGEEFSLDEKLRQVERIKQERARLMKKY